MDAIPCGLCLKISMAPCPASCQQGASHLSVLPHGNLKMGKGLRICPNVILTDSFFRNNSFSRTQATGHSNNYKPFNSPNKGLCECHRRDCLAWSTSGGPVGPAARGGASLAAVGITLPAQRHVLPGRLRLRVDVDQTPTLPSPGTAGCGTGHCGQGCMHYHVSCNEAVAGLYLTSA